MAGEGAGVSAQAGSLLPCSPVRPAQPHLATHVDHAGVRVVEGQQGPIAGVQLLQGHGLLEVLLAHGVGGSQARVFPPPLLTFPAPHQDWPQAASHASWHCPHHTRRGLSHPPGSPPLPGSHFPSLLRATEPVLRKSLPRGSWGHQAAPALSQRDLCRSPYRSTGLWDRALQGKGWEASWRRGPLHGVLKGSRMGTGKQRREGPFGWQE